MNTLKKKTTVTSDAFDLDVPTKEDSPDILNAIDDKDVQLNTTLNKASFMHQTSLKIKPEMSE